MHVEHIYLHIACVCPWLCPGYAPGYAQGNTYHAYFWHIMHIFLHIYGHISHIGSMIYCAYSAYLLTISLKIAYYAYYAYGFCAGHILHIFLHTVNTVIFCILCISWPILLYIKLPIVHIKLESDDDNQESVNVAPKFELQDDGIIAYIHNINIMAFPDEVIRKANRSDCAFMQHSAWTYRAYRTTIGVVGCIRQWSFGRF